MDLTAIKMGLGFAAVVLTSICILFVIYWKLGEASLERKRKKLEQAGKDAACEPASSC